MTADDDVRWLKEEKKKAAEWRAQIALLLVRE